MSRPERPYNFSAGPAILPGPVLARTADAVRSLGGNPDAPLESQLSILEISHRSATYDAIHNEAIALCHEVIGVPASHKVLLLQGGASLQFAAVPMNLRVQGRSACYVDTGAWSTKAIKESKLQGETTVLASSKETGFDRIPALPSAEAYADASYLHITTNNTIFGTEWAELPALAGDVPLVADLSSNIASRPMALDRVAVGYAGAQKNLGPSGLTVVFVREDLLGRESAAPTPSLLRWSSHADKNSLLNTPNTFGIMVLRNVLSWIRDEGGVAAVGTRNRSKADKLYAVLDDAAMYHPHAQAGSRSTMNVTWTLAGESDEAPRSLDQAFLGGGRGRRVFGAQGAPLRGGLPGVDLQRIARASRRRAVRVHAPVREQGLRRERRRHVRRRGALSRAGARVGGDRSRHGRAASRADPPPVHIEDTL